MGHSVHSYAESLLDEEEYIDHAGLVIMRHMIREVSFFCLLTWEKEEKNQMFRCKCLAQMLGAPNGMFGAKWNVRRSKETC